jgi:hypothetical protein
VLAVVECAVPACRHPQRTGGVRTHGWGQRGLGHVAELHLRNYGPTDAMATTTSPPLLARATTRPIPPMVYLYSPLTREGHGSTARRACRPLEGSVGSTWATWTGTGTWTWQPAGRVMPTRRSRASPYGSITGPTQARRTGSPVPSPRRTDCTSPLSSRTWMTMGTWTSSPPRTGTV